MNVILTAPMLGRDGATLDGETFVGRSSVEGGALRIVTEKRGTDDDERFFERNVYSWSR